MEPIALYGNQINPEETWTLDNALCAFHWDPNIRLCCLLVLEKPRKLCKYKLCLRCVIFHHFFKHILLFHSGASLRLLTKFNWKMSNNLQIEGFFILIFLNKRFEHMLNIIGRCLKAAIWVEHFNDTISSLLLALSREQNKNLLNNGKRFKCALSDEPASNELLRRCQTSLRPNAHLTTGHEW